MDGSKPVPERQYGMNLLLAGVVSQVGCVTVVIVVTTLILGLWLDARFGTRPWITILLLVLSVPFTLMLMVWIVRRLTSRIQPAPSIFSNKEAKGDGPQA